MPHEPSSSTPEERTLSAMRTGLLNPAGRTLFRNAMVEQIREAESAAYKRGRRDGLGSAALIACFLCDAVQF